MKYTVTWSAEAERRLTSIRIESKDRSAVTQAAHEIDRELQHDPQLVGEGRSGRTRIHFAKPLGVFFRIAHADRRVDVLTV